MQIQNKQGQWVDYVPGLVSDAKLQELQQAGKTRESNAGVQQLPTIKQEPEKPITPRPKAPKAVAPPSIADAPQPIIPQSIPEGPTLNLGTAGSFKLPVTQGMASTYNEIQAAGGKLPFLIKKLSNLINFGGQ
jgi:hypothetical protein